uniref:Claudin 26 n=1 Tax=Cynoglossus semilaevis TaxID=244447 RepID=A0A3P8VW67_CYNSE
MVFLTTKMMQRRALFVTFGGLVMSFITMFMPLWKTMNSELNEEVGIQCKAYESIMVHQGVPCGPADLQGSYICIQRSRSLSRVGSLSWSGRFLLILSSVLSWVSGLTTLAPISIVAYTTVVDFWNKGFPDVMSRWEYGEAMFSGWFGGLALALGGTLFSIAVLWHFGPEAMSLSLVWNPRVHLLGKFKSRLGSWYLPVDHLQEGLGGWCGAM